VPGYIVIERATKEIFIPYTGYTTGVEGIDRGHAHTRLDGGDVACISFYVPHDFTSLEEAVILLKANASKTNYNIDTYAAYASIGEVADQNENYDETSTYNLSADVISEIDVSALLSGLAAGDKVCVRIVNNEAAPYSVDVYGMRFKYN